MELNTLHLVKDSRLMLCWILMWAVWTVAQGSVRKGVDPQELENKIYILSVSCALKKIATIWLRGVLGNQVTNEKKTLSLTQL